MTSEVEICNLALQWLGQDPIVDLSQNNQTAELCNLNYAPARRAVIQEGRWMFARQRRTFTTRLADDPDRWGPYNFFPIGDKKTFLTVYRLYDDPDARRQITDWSVEGTNLLAREDTVYGILIFDIADYTTYPAQFVHVLAARIAAELAVPVTQSRQLQADMWNIYSSKLDEAILDDRSQGMPFRDTRSPSIDVRAQPNYGN